MGRTGLMSLRGRGWWVGSSADSPEPTAFTEVTPPPERWHFSCACVVTEAPHLQSGKGP